MVREKLVSVIKTILLVVFLSSQWETVQSQNLSLSSRSDVVIASWDAIADATGYHLEWTYKDGYGEKSTSDDNVMFRNGATRIETTKNTYNIPSIYENGTLYVRVRSYKYDDKGNLVVGKWSNSSNVEVRSNDGDEMNWQATVDYAEEGKNKEVMTYFDGTSRARQVVTRNSSNNDIIVGETYYDHQGRPAVQALPVPSLIDNDIIAYHDRFNVYSDGNKTEGYDRKAFDLSTENDCELAAKPMDTVSGSSKYYSTNNPQKNDGYNAYIPDAGNYPFSQTEYTPDNTGRIRRQGGVGPQYQLSSSSDQTTHPTSYYYGKPTQEDLWRLFGSQCGDFSHYQKNMIKDPNGSMQVSYVDMHGRTIATAVAGNSPQSLQSLNEQRVENEKVVSLLDHPSVPVGTTQYFSQFIYLSSTGGTHKFKYSMNLDKVNIGDVCLSCKYKLAIDIKDECGNSVKAGDNQSPFLEMILEGGELQSNQIWLEFSADLVVGNYTITRTLEIDPQMRVEQVNKYLESHNVKGLYDFIEEEVSYTDFSSCKSSDCISSCLEQNFSTYEEYVDCVAECSDTTNHQCEAYYERLKQDMVPGVVLSDTNKFKGEEGLNPVSENQVLGGQYAVYSISSDGEYSSGQYSIFQESIFDNLVSDNNIDFKNIVESSGISYDSIKTIRGFINNFDTKWCEYLAKSYHPEWNLVADCETEKKMMFYDYKMRMIDSYEDAYRLGMLNPIGITNLKNITLKGLLAKDLLMINNMSLTEKMLNYSAGYSIWHMAILMAVQDESFSTTLSQTSPITYPENVYDRNGCSSSTVNGYTVDWDQVWMNFRALYLAARNEVYQTNKNKNKTINSILLNKESDLAKLGLEARVPDMYSQMNNEKSNAHVNGVISQEYQSNIEGKIWQSCVNQATAQADIIMKKLSGCFRDNTIDVSSIKQDFIDIMAYTAYLSGNVMGYSNVPEEYRGRSVDDPVKKPRFYSFESVLVAHNIPLDSLCNPDLITNVSKFGNDNIYDNEKPLDECGCDLIIQMAEEYSKENQLPYNIRSASAYFSEKTGVEISNFNKKLCACRRAKGNNSYWTEESKRELRESQLTIPSDFVCDICVPCSDVNAAISQYKYVDQAFAGLSGIINRSVSDIVRTALTHNLNERFNMNKTFEEYVEFAKDCESLRVGKTVKNCQTTIEAKQLLVTLNKILTFHRLQGTINDSRCYNEINNLVKLEGSSRKVSPETYESELVDKPLSSEYFKSSEIGVSEERECTDDCSLISFNRKSNDSTQTEVTVVSGNSSSRFTLINQDTLQVDNIVHVENMYIDSIGKLVLVVTVVKDNELVQENYYVESDDFNFTNCPIYNNLSELTLCKRGKMSVDMEEDECENQLRNIAIMNATSRYNEYIDTLRATINDTYLFKCFANTNSEALTMTYIDREFHYTLYYYDQAGNLVRTVPPAGVQLIDVEENRSQLRSDLLNGTQSVFTKHRLETRYVYNSLNQLVYQYMPDHDGFNDIASNIYVFDDKNVIGSSFTTTQGITVVEDSENEGQSLLYKTVDNGQHWSPVSFTVSSDLKYTRTFTNGDSYICGSNGVVLVKTSSNVSWAPIHTDNELDLISIMGNSQTPYFIAKDGSTFKLSGSSYSFVSNPFGGEIQLSEISHNQTNAVAVGYSNGNGIVYVGNMNGSTGLVSNWKKLGQAEVIPGQISSIAMDGTYGYANAENGLLFRTKDAGLTWSLVPQDEVNKYKDMCITKTGSMYTLSGDGELSQFEGNFRRTNVKLIAGSDNVYFLTNDGSLQTPIYNYGKIFNNDISEITDFAVNKVSGTELHVYYVKNSNLYRDIVSITPSQVLVNKRNDVLKPNCQGVVVKNGKVYYNINGVITKEGDNVSSFSSYVGDNVWDVSEDGTYVVFSNNRITQVHGESFFVSYFLLPAVHSVSVSGNKAIAVGESGVVLYSEDLVQFRMIPSNTSDILLSVIFANDKAYIGGVNGTLLEYKSGNVSKFALSPLDNGDITSLSYKYSSNSLFMGNSLGQVCRLDFNTNFLSGWQQLDSPINFIDTGYGSKIRIIGNNAMVIDAEY